MGMKVSLRKKLGKKLALLLIVALMGVSIGIGETGPARVSGQDCLSLKSAPLPVQFLAPAQAVADFDGDRLPDWAELTSNGFHKNIRLTLSSPWVTSLSFSTESHQRGSIHAQDIDHDSDNDLIWVSDQQPAHSALWLNNGIGEFTRVNEPSAYITDIKRLTADESQSGLFDSSADEQLLATEENEFQLLTRLDGNPPVPPHAITLPRFGRNCAAELSTSITSYPQRGPPAELF